MNARNRIRPRIEASEGRDAPSTVDIAPLATNESSPDPLSSQSTTSAQMAAAGHVNQGHHNGHDDGANCNCAYIG